MIKLFDSELKIMNIVWREGAVSAKQIADELSEKIGWNKNTTYSLIKRCIGKGAIERSEPNFICRALIPRKDIQQAETNELVNKLFEGSEDLLFASLLSNKGLNDEQIERLRKMVEELK